MMTLKALMVAENTGVMNGAVNSVVPAQKVVTKNSDNGKGSAQMRAITF